MIKAVLFDLDGTLVDTNRLILESFKYTISKHTGKCPEEQELVKFFGEPLIKTLERYDLENARELYNTYVTYNEAAHDSMVKTIDGALETVEALRKKGILVGVVSSKRRPMVERGLKVSKLQELMDVIITPEDTQKHKPDAEPVLKACEVLGINPCEALMVGDSHNDILSGNNAGSKSCLVTYTAVPLSELEAYKPDYMVDSLLEIVDILDRGNREIV